MKAKYINEKARKWIDYLKTNPKKYKTELFDPDDENARCCLGHAFHVLGVKPSIHKGVLGDDMEVKSFEGEFHYMNERYKELGLRSRKGDTKDSLYLISPWDKKLIEARNRLGFFGNTTPVTDLQMLNDHTNLDHREIAEIIEYNKDILFEEVKDD